MRISDWSSDVCSSDLAELLAQLYIELTGGRQIGFALATDIPATQADRTTAKPHIRIIRPARAHRASAEELERHAAFIAGLNNHLWMELGPEIGKASCRDRVCQYV